MIMICKKMPYLVLLRRQKKAPNVQTPQAPIHSKCCIGGFRETGLAFVIVLRHLVQKL